MLFRTLLGEPFCAWCGTSSSLTIHHMKAKNKGGTNDTDNLMVLCKKHHKVIHLAHGIQKGSIVALSPDGNPTRPNEWAEFQKLLGEAWMK